VATSRKGCTREIQNEGSGVEAAACSEAGDEAAASSRARIEDSKRR
jgi:hypothetical protein